MHGGFSNVCLKFFPSKRDEQLWECISSLFLDQIERLIRALSGPENGGTSSLKDIEVGWATPWELEGIESLSVWS